MNPKRISVDFIRYKHNEISLRLRLRKNKFCNQTNLNKKKYMERVF